MGVRLNLGSGIYVLDGFDNLDKINGWLFEDGLPAYPNGSVEAITVATALVYVALEHWPFIFGEFARVLEPGGVLRVMEPDTSHPESNQLGGHESQATLTDPWMVLAHMESVGLKAERTGPSKTLFSDRSLVQNHLHSPEPSVFTVEGVKPVS